MRGFVKLKFASTVFNSKGLTFCVQKENVKIITDYFFCTQKRLSLVEVAAELEFFKGNFGMT